MNNPQGSAKRPTGMFGFTIVWVGQIISLLGTSMTGFAMTIWAYEKTNAATALALVGFFFIAPMLIASPFAGALVDRSNRKMMMMVSDIGGCTATIVMPVTTPQIKIAAVEARGARVVLHGDSYSDAYDRAQALHKRSGATFVHPYDDPVSAIQ